jgi:hypothetical protein
LNINLKLLCGADLIESFAVPGLWKDEDVGWCCILQIIHSKLPRLISSVFIYRLKTLWVIMDWWSFHVLGPIRSSLFMNPICSLACRYIYLTRFFF